MGTVGNTVLSEFKLGWTIMWEQLSHLNLDSSEGRIMP